MIMPIEMLFELLGYGGTRMRYGRTNLRNQKTEFRLAFLPAYFAADAEIALGLREKEFIRR